jgi:RES domain-containing protein
VISAYRLHSARYPGNSGEGAAIYGGRWNGPGVQAIYAASSQSLAVLEVLVHFSVLPKDFVVTPIHIPTRLLVYEIREAELPKGWNAPSAVSVTQERADRVFREFPVLIVPSAIVKDERIYVINPEHADFATIEFLPPEPFQFDPRLK